MNWRRNTTFWSSRMILTTSFIFWINNPRRFSLLILMVA